MPRWRLVVSGRVQGVGYRALVKQVASELGIKGRVKNLADRNVEIFCECEPGDFENFKEIIHIKSDAANLFAPTVREMKVFLEGSDGYGQPPTTFGHFEIDYGAKMTTAEKESIERSEIGILALGGVRSDIKAMHTDLKGSIDSMHADMNTRFDTLDTKYGEINKKMNDLTTELHNSTEALISLTQKIGALIDKKLAE